MKDHSRRSDSTHLPTSTHNQSMNRNSKSTSSIYRDEIDLDILDDEYIDK